MFTLTHLAELVHIDVAALVEVHQFKEMLQIVDEKLIVLACRHVYI